MTSADEFGKMDTTTKRPRAAGHSRGHGTKGVAIVRTNDTPTVPTVSPEPIIKQLDHGYTLELTEDATGWACRVIAPDGRVVDVLTPVLHRGSEQEAWAAGVLYAADDRRKQEGAGA